MDEINSDANLSWITDKIAIGNYLAAQDKLLLRREGIASILCLDGGYAEPHLAACGLRDYEKVPLLDTKGNDPRLFRRAVDALTSLVEEAPPVLVHCHAGRSRSVIVVAAYLMKRHRIGPDEALAEVAKKREIRVTEGLTSLLRGRGRGMSGGDS